MNIEKYFAVLLLVLSGNIYSESLMLTENSLGSLELSENTVVSISFLKEKFPELNISHEIASGDSPDFHYYEAKHKNGEVLFSIRSYINDGDYTLKSSKIDSLVIHSNKIKDQYGISIGNSYADVKKARPDNLKFGANHHDNYLGEGKIWYSFNVYIESNVPGLFESPERIKIESLIEQNPNVTFISWPSPKW